MSYDNHNVRISAKGDPSTGIPSIHQDIENFFWPDLDGEERERVRQILARAFSELWDDKAEVLFDDECPDCGKLKVACNCIPPMGWRG